MTSRPIIVCDHGEERCGIPRRLRERGCTVETQALPTGDYLLSAALAVERKAGRDFADSIRNNRIYHQLETLASTYEYAVLLIEDDSWEGDRELKSPLLGGLFHWISYQPNINVFFSPSEAWSARILHDLAHREQIGKLPAKQLPPRKSRQPQTPAELLARLPGVGPTGARKLLHSFGSVRAVATAGEEELMEVIGPTRGKRLHALLGERGDTT